MYNRLCIIFFYDKDGIVDDYIIYFLKQLRPVFNELCVVVNGKLDDVSQAKLKLIADKILYRENEGLDAYAYKHAIQTYGYKKLADFDEILLTNFTFFGPFYPIDKMFNEMENKNCDWWSLYTCSMKEPFVVGEHLPSFFVVYRKSLLKSKDFKEYWDTLPEIKTYNDSVMFHEERQTPYFDKKGFKRLVYFDFSLYDNRKDNDYWPLLRADELVIKEKFPFLKRRNLYIENGSMNIKLSSNVLRYIKENSDYPLSLIYQNIRRTQNIIPLNEHKKYLKWKIKSVLSLSSKKRASYKSKIEAVMTDKKLYDLFFAPTKEFGGYQELDLVNKTKNSNIFHQDAVALNSGRSGLRYIIRALNIKRMYIPYYTCPSVWQTIKEEGVIPEFYDIDTHFMPVNDFPEDAFILYTNYFGVCSQNVKKLSKVYKNLVVDNTHAFYCKSIGKASFNSPRKFFDVADGGYVYCDEKLDTFFETDISSFRYIAHLKRLETGSNSGYLDFKNNERILDKEPIKCMSRLTSYILNYENFNRIEKIRQKNFNYLHKHLKKYNEISLPIEKSDVPYKYPFVFSDNNLRNACIQNSIFITKCWDMENYELPKESYAEHLQNYLFPIPLDQRYDLKDMEYIVSFILDFINKGN